MKPILIIVAVVVCVYAFTIQGEFTFDDYDSIHYYTTRTNASYTWDGFWHGHHLGRNDRRLLPNAVLTATYLAWQYNTLGYHLVNVLCHCLVCILIYLFCLQVNASRGGAVAAVTVYAIHPIAVGTVAYIVQNAAQWAAIFCLASLVVYAHARARGRHWLCLAAVALWGLACICKENAWIFPLVLVAFDFTIIQRCKISVRGLCSLAVGSLFAGSLIYWHHGYMFKLSKYRHFTMWERFCTEGKIMFIYWSQVFFPRLTAFTINHDVRLCGHPGWWLAFGSICLAVAWYGWKHNRLLLFAVLAFLIMMIPESTVGSLELIFEHRMYLPLLFFVPVLARVNLHHYSLSALLVAYLLFVNIQYQDTWRTQLKTWHHAVKVSPNCPRANVAYARMLLQDNHALQAAGYYERALDCYPKHGGYWQHHARRDVKKYIPLFAEQLNNLTRVRER